MVLKVMVRRTVVLRIMAGGQWHAEDSGAEDSGDGGQ